jgi:DhnA family fructose-bisphosphate aldolase class Ia
MNRTFNNREFLPDAVIARLCETRVADPEFAWRAAQARNRRQSLAPTGKLNILAADHPARRVTKVGEDPLGMADRRDYLARILRVLMSDRVDGLMATMDILEDLLILDGLIREAGGEAMLNGKLLIGSLNRGGLAGTCWELDDPITGPSPETCKNWRLDGAKLLLRIADDEAGSLKTMLASAQAITEANALQLPVFLEPLPVAKTEKGYTVLKTREALARITGVASALGDSSRYLWLKLPYCEGYETVARATTLPILLLGGESAGSPAPFLTQLALALTAGPNVRGALVGRNVLYPGDEDPLAMATAAGGIIHDGWPLEQALDSLAANRGRDANYVARYLGERSLGELV